MEKETWKSVHDSEGLFEISSHGTIRSWVGNPGRAGGLVLRDQPKVYTKNERFNKQGVLGEGHVRLRNEYLGFYYSKPLTWAVYEHFIGEVPANTTYIGHIDGDTQNYYYKNLKPVYTPRKLHKNRILDKGDLKERLQKLKDNL